MTDTCMMKKKILVVDDEKDIIELIAYNLKQEGFTVIRAFDGRILTVCGIGYKFADADA